MTFFCSCPQRTLSCAGSNQVGGELSQVGICQLSFSLYSVSAGDQGTGRNLRALTTRANLALLAQRRTKCLSWFVLVWYYYSWQLVYDWQWLKPRLDLKGISVLNFESCDWIGVMCWLITRFLPMSTSLLPGWIPFWQPQQALSSFLLALWLVLVGLLWAFSSLGSGHWVKSITVLFSSWLHWQVPLPERMAPNLSMCSAASRCVDSLSALFNDSNMFRY